MTLQALDTFALTARTGADALPRAAPARNLAMATSRAEIAVRQSSGEGTPILLIHAERGSSRDFDALFSSAVASDHRLIAFDLPGHGASSEAHDPVTAYTIEGYADTALEALERLGVDNAFVVDLSVEGWIGRELATMFPGMLGLAVVGSRRRSANWNALPGAPPVYEISRLDEEALEPVLQSLELREAALSLAPRLWYGG